MKTNSVFLLIALRFAIPANEFPICYRFPSQSAELRGAQIAQSISAFPPRSKAYILENAFDAQSVLKVFVFGGNVTTRAAVREYDGTVAAQRFDGVVTLKECWRFADRIVLVLEKLKFDLKTAIETAPKWFDAARKTAVFLSVLRIVRALHKHKISHGDLKPHNIMCVDAKCAAVKVIDFGLAAIDKNYSAFGTFKYNPPELFPKSRRTPQSRRGDRWMLAAVALDIVDRRILRFLERFKAAHANGTFEYSKDVYKAFLAEAAKGLSTIQPRARETVLSWLTYEPERRPKIKEMIAGVEALGDSFFAVSAERIAVKSVVK